MLLLTAGKCDFFVGSGDFMVPFASQAWFSFLLNNELGEVGSI